MPIHSTLKWTRAILDALKSREDSDVSEACKVGPYGVCLTHGQVIEECEKEGKLEPHS